jgi:hypothetical protein
MMAGWFALWASAKNAAYCRGFCWGFADQARMILSRMAG